MKHINIKINQKIIIANNLPFTLIAGPCVMESREHALKMAEKLVKITDDLNIPFIFKTSFDKANRSSIHSFRGQKLELAIKVFEEIKNTFGCPVETDYHEPWQAQELCHSVDLLQVPAFLCRQTDLLIAGAKTGLPINVKKAQFMAPWDMKNVIQKLTESNTNQIILTERGIYSGYNTRWLVDMIAIPEMINLGGYPVMVDITHSVAEPGSRGTCSGGKREYAQIIGRAALAVGVAGIFIETHDNPDQAKCDGPNMMKLDSLKEFLKLAKDIDALIKQKLIHNKI